MILAVPLAKFLQCLWLVSIFSLYITVNAGFAYGGYLLSSYSMYLGIWSGVLAFTLFTSIVLFITLRVLQQLKT